MKKITSPILLTLVLLFVSCSGQKINTSYNDCMEKSFLSTGNDFYGGLKKIEDKLLEIGAVKNKTREGYLDAYKKLINDNDQEWKDFYFLLNENGFLEEFSLQIYKVKFLSVCSDLNLDKEEIACNCVNTQKYFFKQLTYKPYNDSEVLDGLFLFTDFNVDSLRYNMTYLLLLNLEEKYGDISN